MKYKFFILLIISSFSLFISLPTEIQFKDDTQSLFLNDNNKFSYIANYALNSNKKYLYIYPKNYVDGMNMNQAIIKIYFKQIQNKESAEGLNLNYLNSDYSSIDFNSGLFIKLSDLKYNTAIISILSDETCKLMVQYRYSNEIIFPSYFRYSNFQLNQFFLEKGQSETINYEYQQGENEYLLILSKTSLRNIEVKVTYDKKDATKEKLYYLYPNGCSVLLDKSIMKVDTISFTINNKNDRKELLLLGYVHHKEDEVFPNSIVNGFQIYLEGNKQELDQLLISGKSGLKQFLTYQIYNKNLDIDFLTSGNTKKETKEIVEYNSMIPIKIDYEGRLRFEFFETPERSAIYFQYLDYSVHKVAQKSLQSLVTGVPKSMLIPEGKSMYHFLPIERSSNNLFFYLRAKTKEAIYVSFESCTNYPEECYIDKEITNGIIPNIGLWYSLPRNESQLQLIYVYCQKDCAYDILMTYEDNEPLFLFPDNNYTKFISDSGTDMFALPVFEYLSACSKSLYIDLTIISGDAKLTLRNGRYGNSLDYTVSKIGNKQSYIISKDTFEKGDYYNKEIYAIVTSSSKNTFYNLMYGSGSETNIKLLSNNLVNIEPLIVPESSQESSQTKVFNFINYESTDMFISISTKLCKSKVVYNNDVKQDYVHNLKVSNGLNSIQINLINDGNLCKAGFEEEVKIFTYHSSQEVLLSENTLVNTTLSSSLSFLHLFKPNEDENADNSFNIEIEKYDLNELTFTYQLKKINFDGNSRSSDVSGQKLTSSKSRYISKSQINKYCGNLKKNELCGLTMTFTSSSSQFSLNLNKNGRYYGNKLTEKSTISSVNNQSPKYFYIDIDKNNNIELLIDSYGQDLKFNYEIINKKQDEESILPLKSSYNLGNQLTIQKGSFSSCSDYCRLYIGVTSQLTNQEDASTPFLITYHYYDDEKIGKTPMNLPLNYYIQYTFNDLKEVNFYFNNNIASMKLNIDLYTIKKKGDDISNVTAIFTGAINQEIKSDTTTTLTVSNQGLINIKIKPSEENAKITFKLRVSCIGELDIIPMIPSYAEKCIKDSCYYLVDDLSPDNEEKSAYFYIPESESSVILYQELKYDKAISTSLTFNSTSTDDIKRPNWLEYKIPESRDKVLILKIDKGKTLYSSYYHNPNTITLKYGEKRMFTIKRGSKDSIKFKINRLTTDNYKYRVKLHSVMGNGIFTALKQKYALGFENAYKEDISIIFDNDKKYEMELEAVNRRFSKDGPNGEHDDFTFTIEYTIDTGNSLNYPITFDKINSFSFYRNDGIKEFSFYLERKEIKSTGLDMNIKIYSSTYYEIKSYFADTNKNCKIDSNDLDNKIKTFIEGGGFTFSKLEVTSDILEKNSDTDYPYIYIQIKSNGKSTPSNTVQIDLYPYDMINTNHYLARDQLYIQKIPSNTENYQLFLGKSEINYGEDAKIYFIPPLSDKYNKAIAQTNDGKTIIKEDEPNLVFFVEEERFGFDKYKLDLGTDKKQKYLSFNIYTDENNRESKEDSFVFTYRNPVGEDEYLFRPEDLEFNITGKEKRLEFGVNGFKPKYEATGTNIFIINAYKEDDVKNCLDLGDDKLSLYLLFNKKPAYTIYQELTLNSDTGTKKKIEDTKIKAGKYYFTGVSVLKDNGREQFIGYPGKSYNVDSSSLFGELLDYMKNHVFASILIIIIILFILGIMVNICRAERKGGRISSVKVELDGQLMDDKGES